jgi:hypothetical protein
MSLPRKCPYLPAPDKQMNYRCLRESRKKSETAFYIEALKYGHYLWLNGHAGRSILALTRALYADVSEATAILDQWPLPYAALKWVVASHPFDSFPGNPRISFQHQATRLCGERQSLRRARAWAVWALVRKAKPTLPGDYQQAIQEPTLDWIEARLQDKGHANEVAIWQAALGQTLKIIPDSGE